MCDSVRVRVAASKFVAGATVQPRLEHPKGRSACMRTRKERKSESLPTPPTFRVTCRAFRETVLFVTFWAQAVETVGHRLLSDGQLGAAQSESACTHFHTRCTCNAQQSLLGD